MDRDGLGWVGLTAWEEEFANFDSVGRVRMVIGMVYDLCRGCTEKV